MNETIYIHYGHNKFDKDKFKPIKNVKSLGIKPNGGFWGCRKDANRSWFDWCIREDYEVDSLKKSFEFTISKNAKILTIDNHKKLDKIPKRDDIDTSIVYMALDFEKLSEGYDAIEVFISKDEQLYWDLYGWDCDSILIMNPDIIEEVRSSEN